MSNNYATKSSRITQCYEDSGLFRQRIQIDDKGDSRDQFRYLVKYIENALNSTNCSSWFSCLEQNYFVVIGKKVKEVRKFIRVVEDICDDPPDLPSERPSIFKELEKMAMLGPESQAKQQLAEHIIRQLLAKISSKKENTGDLYSAIRLVMITLGLDPRDYKETNPGEKP